MSRLEDAFPVSAVEDAAEHARAAVHINGADLRSEMERLPSDLAHYGATFARSHRRMLAAKMILEEVRAAAYLVIRETLIDLLGKTTEAQIDAHVLRDVGVRAARAELVEAEYEREHVRSVCDALRAKRENLTSLALIARAELAGTHGFRDPREGQS